MNVHLYALCWNELDILPFFFRHYDGFITTYHIFDNGSTDGSIQFLRNRPNVELHHFTASDLDSFVLSEQALSNECWKEARQTADWVIVTDVDEHLYHPSIADLLWDYRSDGITLVPAIGFEMISEEFPAPEEKLCETRTLGTPNLWHDKASIFNPRAIREIYYDLGRHSASPKGEVILPATDELWLLHYKHLGYERTRARYLNLRAGLGPKDLANGWGSHYFLSDAEFLREWRTLLAEAIDVIAHPPCCWQRESPWWQPLRQQQS
jgi:hypothetical protein